MVGCRPRAEHRALEPSSATRTALGNPHDLGAPSIDNLARTDRGEAHLLTPLIGIESSAVH